MMNQEVVDEAALNEEASRELEAMVAAAEQSSAAAPEGTDADEGRFECSCKMQAERAGVIEALIFRLRRTAECQDDRRSAARKSGSHRTKQLAELAQEFNARNGGLQLREVAGGWQFATRPEYHEHVRAFLKIAAQREAFDRFARDAGGDCLQTTGNGSGDSGDSRGAIASSIKTLLDKKLIVAKGRKETVGRPMMYGTSKEFLMQFGLKDLSELPSMEDFQDLAGGS